MQQNPTPSTQATVTPKQEAVLQQLLTGSSISAAADTTGIDRTTIHRWLRDDDAFAAALNRGRAELRREMEGRLEELTRKAVETVLRACEKNDTRAAIAVLKGLGVFSGSLPSIGPSSAQEIGEKKQIRAAEKRMFQSLQKDLLR